jgi:hypothetical protein
VRGAQAGKPLADLSIPESYRWVPPAVPAGPPFNVAQLFMRMAEGIRKAKSVSPDFDVAVKRHQLLDGDSEGVGHGNPPDSLASSADGLATCSTVVNSLQIRMVAGYRELVHRKEQLIAEACNHPNGLVLPFSFPLVRVAA